jgi:serine/threonine protein kinase
MGKMVFIDGLFHGDPHPGNFFVEEDGTLAIIDFGIVGSLHEDLRSDRRRLPAMGSDCLRETPPTCGDFSKWSQPGSNR